VTKLQALVHCNKRAGVATMESLETLGIRHARKRGWVGARRVALLYVSSRPPLRTGLTAFTVSGSAPVVDLHGATMKHLFPFRRHPQDFTHV